MSLLGKEPVVRLERLEERVANPEGQTRRHSYDLVSDPLWIDDMVSALTQQLGLIDTVYGSSVYMPVAENAQYQITASISGLVDIQGRKMISEIGKDISTEIETTSLKHGLYLLTIYSNNERYTKKFVKY
jgi:hypothetical protein